MTKRGEFNKFMVWRTYHQLKADLGRVPYASDIATEVGITRSAVSKILKKLKSCEAFGMGEGSLSRRENPAEMFGASDNKCDVFTLMMNNDR